MGFELFNYPHPAVFGKILPKSKIYEFAKPSNAVKELFVKQVEQITWEYKLSPETINIPPGDGVQEIQIFEIRSKVSAIDEEVFRTIDESVPSHVFYEVMLGDNIKLVAAHKRQSEADATKWVTGTYFESEWVPSSKSRVNLPIALRMGGLYSHMLRTLIPGTPKVGESLREQAERFGLLRIKSMELEKLNIKLMQEKQFNRKVEINRKIRLLKDELVDLGPL